MRTLRITYFRFLKLPIWHRAKLFIALPICLSPISIDLRQVQQVLVQGRQGGHSCNCNNKSNKSLYKSWPQPQLTRENLKARVGEAFSVPASAAGTRPLARKGISLGILSVYFVSTYQQQRLLNRSFDLVIQTIVISNIMSPKIPDFAPTCIFIFPSYFIKHTYNISTIAFYFPSFIASWDAIV